MAEPYPLLDADRVVNEGLCVDVRQRQPRIDFFLTAKVLANCFYLLSLGKELQQLPSLRAEQFSVAWGNAM